MPQVHRLCLLLIFAAGCSAKDPPTQTPDYHNGTPTNRSSVNSWELNNAPLYTQPGVNSGRPVVLKPIASQRGFEPYDPVAQAVYAAWEADGGVPLRYVSTAAKHGVVIVSGTVGRLEDKTRAVRVAKGVAGVTQVVDKIIVRPPGGR